MNYFEQQKLAYEIREFSKHLASRLNGSQEPRFWLAALNDDGVTVGAYFSVKGWPHLYKKPITGTLDEIKNEIIHLTIYLPNLSELTPIRPPDNVAHAVWEFVRDEFGIERDPA